MTSSQGPPIPLVGPHQMASLAGIASSMSHAHLQKHHDLPLGYASEPDSKRRKTDEKMKTINNTSPVLFSDSYMTTVNLNGEESGPTAGHPNPSLSKRPSLLPDRRALRHPTGKRKQKGSNLAIERAAMKHDVQTKAYVAEPPNSAPRYQRTRQPLPDISKRAMRLLLDAEPADFFPWSGHHPEDMLNDVTTRNGFYDKPAASHNESLTAKPSVLSSLKNKSGLQLLSAHFVSALNQRERHSTITASSTFKPPPRVTLTDAKKEAWLRDLADSEIPLRRLSRTIPHGIRGKILLDHCLSKNIPISRAIWLVKCVGANEIRACKRKGTSGNFTVGGEAKWIKDWTTNVEQFLESIIDSCGSENWKASMSYGLRLVSFIHAEHLLDRGEYYKWLIGHLATNDLDEIPIWLLIMKNHRKDLLRCREHGILLASALLTQLNHSRKPANQKAYDLLFRELTEECRALLTDSSDCFLLPRCWNANKQAIREIVVSEDKFLQSRFDDLTLRIVKLENNAYDEHTTAPRSSEQNIVVALDSLLYAPNYPKIAKTCLRAVRTGDELVKICLQWATSTFRSGRYRIYAAARLFRIWSKHSIDLQKPIHDFLALGKKMSNIDWADFHSLCAELVSSRHFSVGRYCQWLMARGAFDKYSGKGSGDVFEVQLLFELPLHRLPDHIASLRRSLLLSIGIVAEQSEAATVMAQAQIAKQLPAIFPNHTPIDESLTDHVRMHAMTRAQKSAIAWWIRHFILSYVKTQKEQEHRSIQEPYLRVSEQDFRIICQVFEDLEEFVLFADVLCALVVIADDGALLPAITYTINYHFDIFNSLGTAKHIFRLLFNQKKLPSSQGALQSSFTLALLDLGVRLPDPGSEVRSLRKDEALLNSKQSAAAPSPISEDMLEAVNSDKTVFLEEMDQVLANGTTMDHTTRVRCFGSIMDHLEKSWGEAAPLSCQFPGLLARLRAFDERSFDGLAAAWLKTLIAHSMRPPLSHVLIPLICHDVFTLGAIVDQVIKHSENRSQGQGALVALETLEMLSSEGRENSSSLGCRGYRFLQQRQNILQSHLESLVPLVHNCIQAARSMDSSISSEAGRILESGSTKSFMRMIMSQVTIAGKPTMQYSAGVRSALKDILSREWVLQSTILTVREKIAHVLDSVSDLNIPLSQLGLEIILESPSETVENIPDTLAEVLLEKLTSAMPHSRVALWSYLLSTLPANCAMSIHERIVRAIMSEIGTGLTLSSTDARSTIEQLLDIAMVTSSNISVAATVPFVEQFLERLSKLGSSLRVNKEEDFFKPELGRISSQISVLLRLLTIHQTAILNPDFSQSHLAQICLSLAYLYLYATESSCTTLAIYTLDILAILSDALSQDTRSDTVQTLSGSQGLQDPRIYFIFGDNNACVGGEWLRLVLGGAPIHDATKTHPHSLRHWEMMQDATPVVTENDTCLSLTLFAAKKSVV